MNQPAQKKFPPVGAKHRPNFSKPLSLSHVRCCICDTNCEIPLAVGEDFEYRTSPDTFLAVQCKRCSLVYLNPRPTLGDLDQIYPPNYHAYEFSQESFGFVYRVRQRLEAKRLLSYCKGLRSGAKIVDIGAGDGFHLELLQKFGDRSWQLEGVEPSERAVLAARNKGLQVHQGTVQEVNLAQGSYDLALMIATIEHVDDPAAVLRSVRSLLKPGGRIVIITDNTDTLDFKLSKARHWGGYHFPRHWNLFNRNTMRNLARKIDLEIVELDTIVSPVNWVYSIRNALVDGGAPRWIYEQFSLSSPITLGIFTIFDIINQKFGKGALLRVTLQRPD
jgi:2-polyprenyl-3-methyl-5-hydroxy-6-metoxy-1,4-benzoquinol methylase